MNNVLPSPIMEVAAVMIAALSVVSNPLRNAVTEDTCYVGNKIRKLLPKQLVSV